PAPRRSPIGGDPPAARPYPLLTARRGPDFPGCNLQSKSVLLPHVMHPAQRGPAGGTVIGNANFEARRAPGPGPRTRGTAPALAAPSTRPSRATTAQPAWAPRTASALSRPDAPPVITAAGPRGH